MTFATIVLSGEAQKRVALFHQTIIMKVSTVSKTLLSLILPTSVAAFFGLSFKLDFVPESFLTEAPWIFAMLNHHHP